MSKVVMIVDIDTTIANNEARALLLDRECIACLAKLGTEHRAQCHVCGGSDHRVSQSSWDKFLDPEAMLGDKPVQKAQDVIYKMRELDMEFHFLTGRGEGLRDVTEAWLTEHFGWHPGREMVIMRSKIHDGLPASVYKEKALKSLIKKKGLEDCKFIFMEDDPYVFRMYQQYGIVIKCPEGWEHFMPEPASGTEAAWAR